VLFLWKFDRTTLSRGSKSRNKVSVGEPAEGSLPSYTKKSTNETNEIEKDEWQLSLVFKVSKFPVKKVLKEKETLFLIPARYAVDGAWAHNRLPSVTRKLSKVDRERKCACLFYSRISISDRQTIRDREAPACAFDSYSGTCRI
jgi:hypothetical protein